MLSDDTSLQESDSDGIAVRELCGQHNFHHVETALLKRSQHRYTQLLSRLAYYGRQTWCTDRDRSNERSSLFSYMLKLGISVEPLDGIVSLPERQIS